MSKVLGFMKQVARGLQVEGNFGTAHVYRSSLNAIIAYRGKDDFAFNEVTSEWLKGFEVYLRSRGCSWNTVSTYLRTFRAVYNRAVDLHRAPYVPHLFRSVYTGTRADHKRALGNDDMKRVFCKLSQSSGASSNKDTSILIKRIPHTNKTRYKDVLECTITMKSPNFHKLEPFVFLKHLLIYRK